MMASLGQAHTCRLSGEHMSGLECLSDPQILPILYAMDPETLLSCGRANRRLNRLVCDKQVWKNLLKGIDYLGDFKGVAVYVDKYKEANKRMGELVKFVVYKGNSQMGAELVKEVASRFKIDSTAGYYHNSYYSSTKKGSMSGLLCRFKITVSIQGWDDAPHTFDMSEDHLNELHNIAQAVGAKFTIKEVKTFEHLGPYGVLIEPFKLIAALVGQQEEGLDKLELVNFTSWQGIQENKDIFYSLVRGSKEWKVHKIILYPMWQNGEFIWPENVDWAALARIAGTGHIGEVQFPIYNGAMNRVKKEGVRAVWEIAERFVGTVSVRFVIGGGRAREEDPKTTWEEAYENHLHNIC